MASWSGSRRACVRIRPPWIAASVAVASRSGSADGGPPRPPAEGAPFHLQVDQRVEPRADGLPAIEGAGRTEDELGVVLDDGAQQVGPALEVVVELTLADLGAIDQVVQARLGNPSFADQR